MLQNYGAILIFIIIAFFFLLSLIIMNKILSPKKKENEKLETYECGEPTLGDTKIKLNSHFFNVALFYILFDVEIALLLPVALVFKSQVNKENLIFPFWVMSIFIFILIVGLIYEWKVGNLEWIKNKENE